MIKNTKKTLVNEQQYNHLTIKTEKNDIHRNLSAITTIFAPGKSWDKVRSTAAPYTESRLTHLVRNKCVGFPVVEQCV
jgi:hypothetical protein